MKGIQTDMEKSSLKHIFLSDFLDEYFIVSKDLCLR